jgi:hypothetical protein
MPSRARNRSKWAYSTTGKAVFYADNTRIAIGDTSVGKKTGRKYRIEEVVNKTGLNHCKYTKIDSGSSWRITGNINHTKEIA